MNKIGGYLLLVLGISTLLLLSEARGRPRKTPMEIEVDAGTFGISMLIGFLTSLKDMLTMTLLLMGPHSRIPVHITDEKLIKSTLPKNSTAVPCAIDNDLVIMIEDSAKVGALNFSIVLDFTAQLAQAWKANPNNRVSVGSFSSVKVQNCINLKESEFLSSTEIGTMVRKCKYNGGGGQLIHEAIGAVTDQYIMHQRNGARKNLLLLTTDTSTFTHPLLIAMQLQVYFLLENSSAFSIGIGTNAYYSDLFHIAGKREHVFKLGQFNELLDILHPVTLAMCEK